MQKKIPQNDFEIIIPKSGRGAKEFILLLRRRRKQVEKAIDKLKKSPTDTIPKGIEKLDNDELGQYTIRVSRGDRIFYDVDKKNRRVFILRAGSHDIYKLI